MRLTIRHDETEYTIPITIEYRCRECHDTKRVWKGQYDDIEEVDCLFCFDEDNT